MKDFCDKGFGEIWHQCKLDTNTNNIRDSIFQRIRIQMIFIILKTFWIYSNTYKLFEILSKTERKLSKESQVRFPKMRELFVQELPLGKKLQQCCTTCLWWSQSCPQPHVLRTEADAHQTPCLPGVRGKGGITPYTPGSPTPRAVAVTYPAVSNFQ